MLAEIARLLHDHLDLAAAGADDARAAGDERARGKSGKRGQAEKQAEDCEAAGRDRHGLTKLKTAMLVPRYIGTRMASGAFTLNRRAGIA